ncbi:MAG: hypothetical protein K8L99_14575 [Anaerolineae bacterium]|nr:hypothetical protein [Anaerolineae bacterium]
MITYLHHEKKFHILIVNPWLEDVTLLQSLFAPRYHLSIADNDQTAFETLETGTVDLVLLADARDTNVIESLQTIKSRPEWSDTAVLFILDGANQHLIADGLRSGAADFLTRPLVREVVRLRVDTQITLKQKALDHDHLLNELRSVQQMHERFFTIASHDLKNPINNIRMAMFLLDKAIERNDVNLKMLSNVDQSLDTMEYILSDFLDIAALQSPTLGLQLEPLKVEDLLWEAVLQFGAAAIKKNIELRIDDVDGVIYADLHRMQQVISNLVSNAIKYSPWSKTVTVFSEARKDLVRILVADEGPGVPAEERDQLFREFGRLSTRPTGGEASTGLGLWIVKQLVLLQKGRVGAEFPPDGGAIFWVELPMSDKSSLSEQQSLVSAV